MRRNVQTVSKRSFLTIIKAYEKGVYLKFGELQGIKDPGLRLNIPVYHKVMKVDMRSTVDQLGYQELYSEGENVTFHVNGTVQYRVVDPLKATLNVDEYWTNTRIRAQNSIREHLSGMPIDDISAKREQLNEILKEDLSQLESDWGIRVERVQLENIKFDDSLKAMMSQKAKAQRSADSKVIQAKANIETAKKYAEASKEYEDSPVSLQLRQLDMLQSIASHDSVKFVFYPLEVLSALRTHAGPTPKDRQEILQSINRLTDEIENVRHAASSTTTKD